MLALIPFAMLQAIHTVNGTVPRWFSVQNLPLLFPAVGYIPLETNSLMRTVVGYGSTCDAQAENKIAQCSEELISMGVFSALGGKQTTLSDMKSHSQIHFVQMCG